MRFSPGLLILMGVLLALLGALQFAVALRGNGLDFMASLCMLLASASAFPAVWARFSSSLGTKAADWQIRFVFGFMVLSSLFTYLGSMVTR